MSQPPQANRFLLFTCGQVELLHRISTDRACSKKYTCIILYHISTDIAYSKKYMHYSMYGQAFSLQSGG